MTHLFTRLGATLDPQWQFWPFGPGFGEGLWPSIARLGFVALILGVIFLFLRILFGPGGRLRDPEIDKQAEEMRRQEMEELDREFAKGELSEFEYERRKKRILS